MTSVALSGGPIHLGLDVSKNKIAVGILRYDEQVPDTEMLVNDEASVRRLIGRFPERGRLECPAAPVWTVPATERSQDQPQRRRGGDRPGTGRVPLGRDDRRSNRKGHAE